MTDRQKKYAQAYLALSKKLKRPAKSSEVAKKLGVTIQAANQTLMLLRLRGELKDLPVAS